MTRPIPAKHSPATPSADYQNALNYLYGRINYEKIGLAAASQYAFRLQRMTELLRHLDLGHFLYQNTATKPPTLVHLAGTKGKGSTASLIASACTQSGYRTGLYTSPHLERLEERFVIDGQICTNLEFVQLVKRIQDAAEAIELEHGKSTFFELTTAMAMLHFANHQCDVMVAEVGLGGRLDSTNVLHPTVSVITSIGLDHQNVLGDDLVSIAGEKAGIIKSNVPVISGVEQEEAIGVVEEHCRKQGADWFQLGTDFNFKSQPLPDWGSRIEFFGSKPDLPKQIDFNLAMEGKHQAKNAAVAAAALFVLRQEMQRVEHAGSIKIEKALSHQTIKEAFSSLQVPARLERFHLADKTVAIVDSSHNEDSIRALANSLKQRVPGQKYIIVFGTSQDKDAEVMLNILTDIPGKLILTQYHSNPRYVPTKQLRELLPAKHQSTAILIDDPIKACEEAELQAKFDGAHIVVCGSFFLAAETRTWMLAKS